ncbi:hypothetical protein [Anaeromyxobacter oryzae]|uniref:Uncharacterized protein n=1 Tax=Anaeromyxobacter oryzae TaxID=2918170 RepID=A0ABN6MY49_9BACT|nr:hypothetical protein [Anaeromyxobacter oryzae]BDG05796.1 hypothetical protein AMOR_47920 [Anaeromyxobacter oryzae]
MAETQSTAAVTPERPTHRGPLEELQARFETLESEGRGRLRKALGAGSGALLGLDEALARVSSEDWSVEGLRKRLGVLRARAENLRAAALKRVAEMPGSAVSAIATTSRTPVQNLARELDRLAKRLDPADVDKH